MSKSDAAGGGTSSANSAGPTCGPAGSEMRLATPVTLRPIGCNSYEVRRRGVVLGSAFFQKERRRTSVEVWAWVDRPGEDTIHLNPGSFDDFAREVKGLFG